MNTPFLRHAISRTIVWVILPACFVLLTVGVAIYAQAQEPADWGADDWAAVAIALILGVLFLVLAQLAQRRNSEIVSALSNAGLLEKIGTIASDSMQTLTGSSGRSLKIAHDSVSAMPLFRLADRDEQDEFLTVVQDAYSALTLNTFVRSRTLPITMCKRLHRDGDILATRLNEAVARTADRGLRHELTRLGEHVRECLELEGQWRRFRGQPHSTKIAVEFVRDLYRNDLLVYHNWQADNVWPSKAAKGFEAWIESVSDISLLADYYTPWHVKRAGNSFMEVTYNEKEREPGTVVRAQMPVNCHPLPLQHREVLISDLRDRGISRMRKLLEAVTPRGFALLVYELRDGRRLVLDGNHRLAAALGMHRDGTWYRTDEWIPLVALFVLKEGDAPPLGPTSRRVASDGSINEWAGFNPEVEMLHRLTAPTSVLTDGQG